MKGRTTIRQRMGWMMMLGLVAVAPTVASAATFLGGDEDELTVEAPVLSDLYAAGNKVTVKEDVAEDLMVAGQVVAVSSVIGEDVYAVGQFIRLEGVIEDDAHAAGNAIEIEGRVEGDVLAAGQSISISQSAVVTGDVLAAGQSVVIEGVVQGKVKVAGESLRIAEGATVEGDVEIWGGEPVIAEGASIGGKVVRHERKGVEPAATGQVLLLSWVRGVVAQFVLALLVAAVLPVLIAKSLRAARKSPGKSLLVGFGWMVLIGPAVLLLLFSLIGIPVALLLVFLTGAAMVVALGLAALLVGKWVLKRLDTKHEAEEAAVWPQALLGAALYQGVQLLGPPGWIVSLAVLLIAMGGLVLAAWKRRVA